MTNDKRPSGWLKRYTERVVAGPQNTPEEIAESKASREELLGTSNEWAQMQPDLKIAQNIVHWLPDGTRAHGTSMSDPGDPNYEELCKTHKLEKPGDTSTILKRLINGDWVIEDGPELE